MFPIDMFVIVFFLFEFEYMMNEELLKIFIGIVDTQLFETISLEIFETEYVQNAETKHETIENKIEIDRWELPFSIGWRILGFEYSGINLLDNPNEHFAVDTFDKCVSMIKRNKMFLIQRNKFN